MVLFQVVMEAGRLKWEEDVHRGQKTDIIGRRSEGCDLLV